MARAGGAAVEPALLLGRRVALAAGRALGRVHARSQRLEHRPQPLDRLVVAADHQAEAAVEAEDAAARAHVDPVDPALAQVGLPPQVVDVVRVAAVDDRVAVGEVRREVGDDPSTIAAGTISQTERGASSCCASSSSDDAVDSTCGSKVFTS